MLGPGEWEGIEKGEWEGIEKGEWDGIEKRKNGKGKCRYEKGKAERVYGVGVTRGNHNFITRFKVTRIIIPVIRGKLIVLLSETG
jgi:hypothetical protein